MKSMPELQKRGSLALYCHVCERMRDQKIIEIDKNGIMIKCALCGEETRIHVKDYLQAKTEEATYCMDNNYKIGQKLFHAIFNDRGDIVGKTRSVIYVNFERIGVKKLACTPD